MIVAVLSTMGLTTTGKSLPALWCLHHAFQGLASQLVLGLRGDGARSIAWERISLIGQALVDLLNNETSTMHPSILMASIGFLEGLDQYKPLGPSSTALYTADICKPLKAKLVEVATRAGGGDDPYMKVISLFSLLCIVRDESRGSVAPIEASVCMERTARLITMEDEVDGIVSEFRDDLIRHRPKLVGEAWASCFRVMPLEERAHALQPLQQESRRWYESLTSSGQPLPHPRNALLLLHTYIVILERLGAQVGTGELYCIIEGLSYLWPCLLDVEAPLLNQSLQLVYGVVEKDPSLADMVREAACDFDRLMNHVYHHDEIEGIEQQHQGYNQRLIFWVRVGSHVCLMLSTPAPYYYVSKMTQTLLRLVTTHPSRDVNAEVHHLCRLIVSRPRILAYRAGSDQHWDEARKRVIVAYTKVRGLRYVVSPCQATHTPVLINLF